MFPKRYKIEWQGGALYYCLVLFRAVTSSIHFRMLQSVAVLFTYYLAVNTHCINNYRNIHNKRIDKITFTENILITKV